MRFLSAWGPVLLLQGLIYLMSSRPLGGPPLPVPHLDKVAHFMEYAALGVLLYRALRLSGGRRKESWVGTVLLVAALGFGDEYLQSRVPGRTPSVADWVADLVGGTAGVVIGSLLDGRGVGRWARSSAKRL